MANMLVYMGGVLVLLVLTKSLGQVKYVPQLCCLLELSKERHGISVEVGQLRLRKAAVPASRNLCQDWQFQIVTS